MTTTHDAVEQATAMTIERPTGWRTIAGSPVTAVAVIWLTTGLVSVFAPDMVTGSEQEHLPIAAFSVWLWASLATAYILMGASGTGFAPGLVIGVCAVWSAVLIAGIWAPVMVTGTDPTRIPIAVLIAPVVGAVTTGFLALHHARGVL